MVSLVKCFCLSVFNVNVNENANSYISENDAVQNLWQYGFPPVWVCIWHTKFNWHENAHSQISHEYDSSPVCLCMWLTNVDLLGNAHPQSS